MAFLVADEWEEPQMKEILTPLEGYPAEVHSINLAFSLAECSKASVSLLHCEEKASKTLDAWVDRFQKHANLLSKKLEVPFTYERVKRRRASVAILKKEKASGCDLVIMGMARHSKHRHLLGATVRRVARKSDVPVLVVTSWVNDYEKLPKPMLRKILLPIRDTCKDVAALRLAAALKMSSAATDAELIALNLTPLPSVTSKKAIDTPEVKLGKELFMDDLSIFTEQTGLEVVPKHIAAPKVGDATIDVAETEKVDMIILGGQPKPGRLRGGRLRGVLGSVARQVAAEAPGIVVIAFV
jgi:nucleotide-binding universal stress UspA family protein